MSIIEQAIKLEWEQSQDEAHDLIINVFDDFFQFRNFEEANELFEDCNKNIRRLSPELLITILGITYKPKDSLPNREEFFSKVLARFTELMGAKKAETLLNRYK